MLDKIQLLTLKLLAALAVKPLDRGAAAVEYGLLVALVAAVIATIVTTIGIDLQSVFQNATDMFP